MRFKFRHTIIRVLSALFFSSSAVAQNTSDLEGEWEYKYTLPLPILDEELEENFAIDMITTTAMQYDKSGNGLGAVVMQLQLRAKDKETGLILGEHVFATVSKVSVENNLLIEDTKKCLHHLVKNAVKPDQSLRSEAWQFITNTFNQSAMDFCNSSPPIELPIKHWSKDSIELKIDSKTVMHIKRRK